MNPIMRSVLNRVTKGLHFNYMEFFVENIKQNVICLSRFRHGNGLNAREDDLSAKTRVLYVKYLLRCPAARPNSIRSERSKSATDISAIPIRMQGGHHRLSSFSTPAAPTTPLLARDHHHSPHFVLPQLRPPAATTSCDHQLRPPASMLPPQSSSWARVSFASPITATGPIPSKLSSYLTAHPHFGHTLLSKIPRFTSTTPLPHDSSGRKSSHSRTLTATA
jgi:hypothetical protein